MSFVADVDASMKLNKGFPTRSTPKYLFSVIYFTNVAWLQDSCDTKDLDGNTRCEHHMEQ